jgi:predicted AAA+ superfamily ATPase
MKRDIYKQLIEWKTSQRRKPLLLEGARQTGKTYALQHFGKHHYEQVAYLNFERDKKLANYFEQDLNPERLIKVLSVHARLTINPKNTLLIFDEIQECPHALNSLKYFCEEAGEYHIASAGSLLGIKTANTNSFPVGKVNFLKLFPMNFNEFISAMGEDELRHYLEHYPTFENIPEALHLRLIDWLKTYYFVGGMPEAVFEYKKHDNFQAARDVHIEIVKSYENDFSKHAPASQFMKIVTIWEHIHTQLAKENKKFIFSVIKKSARGREYEEAIQWLVDAGLIYKCFHCDTIKHPLHAYKDSHIFKIYLLDIGLLGEQGNLAADTIINGDQLFTEFKGACTENFVAQELKAAGHKNLFYWTSSGTAEVDFLVEHKNNIYPLEVKAGISKKKKSLTSYAHKYNAKILSRSTLMNLKQDDNVYNYPLYMVNQFPKKTDAFFQENDNK